MGLLTDYLLLVAEGAPGCDLYLCCMNGQVVWLLSVLFLHEFGYSARVKKA